MAFTSPANLAKNREQCENLRTDRAQESAQWHPPLRPVYRPNPTPVITPRILYRFWEKVDRRSTRKCWLWKAALDGRGYGLFKLDGKMWKASRVSWLIAHGLNPAWDHVLHQCDKPACVNPAHLFLGDQQDNMRDATEKGRCKRGYAGRFLPLKNG